MSAGYHTALVGKAHFQPLHGTDEFPSIEAYPTLQDLDFWRNHSEPFYGFEHIELARNHTDEAHVGQHYAIWLEERGCTNWKNYYRPPTGSNSDQKRKWEIPEEYHYGTWIAERSCSLLDQYSENDEPFFLWSSFFDPHPKYLAPEPWDTMYDPESLTVPSIVEGEHDNNPPHFQMTQTENPDFSPYKSSGQGLHGFGSHLHDQGELAKDIACYYGMISLMDKQIGQIIDKLEALGLANDTLVVFTSDHGHFFGHHGLTSKGAFHYEDMVRVPLIVSQPGKIPSGEVSNSLQSLVDFAPSFLSACDIQIPHAMTGTDQTDVWYGKRKTIRDHVIVENHHDPSTVHVKTYVGDRYKLTVYYQHEYGELFDLETDPKEINNLWKDPDSQGLKSELITKLLFAEMGKESVPMPRVSGA